MSGDKETSDGSSQHVVFIPEEKSKPFDLEAAFTTRSSIYYLHACDNPSIMIVSDLLKGQANYLVWSKDMMMWLVTRHKQNFINGKISKPSDENSDGFEAWETVNGVIFLWIINACEKNIATSIRSADSAVDAWKILKVRYSQGQAPLRYQIGQELAALSNIVSLPMIITSSLKLFGIVFKISARRRSAHVEYALVEQFRYGKKKQNKIRLLSFS